jgi:hypothetical protein
MAASPHGGTEMTLGINHITLRNEIINHLSNQSGLGHEAIDKIADAVADAIEQNNKQIESQLKELGILS